LGYAGLAMTGSLEPTAPSGPTMKTLDEIPPAWSQKLPAAQRFVLVLDGEAVLDKETGLVWERSPDTTLRNWYVAMDYGSIKTVGGRKGWRLPTVEELLSLVDTSVSGSPKLPSGHPFTIVSSTYWSSTTLAGNTNNAYLVGFIAGNRDNLAKTGSYYTWYVRGGHGHDGQ